MRKRILIVEDDDAQREVLERLLRSEGFYVESAVDGLDAVQRARLAWFDVILMDYELPEVDGVAAACLITELTSDHGSPKIVALTGNPAMARDGAADSAHAFFAVESKPWKWASLLQTIRRCCGSLDEEAGMGATCAWPKPRHGPGNEPDRRADRPFRILLVDDDELPRLLLTAAFSAMGYQVDMAADGLQALLMMGNTVYDAAILNYALPKMNGTAAARLARDLLALSDRPRLIALSAHGVPQADTVASVFDNIIPYCEDFQDLIGKIQRCVVEGRAVHS